jgi:anti-sigma-K factor RskA
MRTRWPEPHTLAGAYALDALTRADRFRFERHLARCQQCAAEISGLRETTARLAVAAAAKPPAGLTQRAVAAAARTRQLPPLTRGTPLPWLPRRRAAAAFAGPAAGTPADRPFRRIWLPRVALAFAGTMVILAAALGLASRSAQHQLQQDQLHSHAIAAVLTAGDAHMISARVNTGGTATIVMSGREHALVFAAAGLAALPSTSCYEMWLMGSGGDQPAAMLPPPRHGMTGPVLASGLKPGERLGLTIEPAGGSPHPTTPAILQIVL